MHLGNLLLSLYHAAKTKRWQNLKFWKSSNKIYLKVAMGANGAIKDYADQGRSQTQNLGGGGKYFSGEHNFRS